MLFQYANWLTRRLSAGGGRHLLLTLALIMGGAGFSTNVQASIFAEGSVVLVLKLVSTTRVQPTTGVVVSADGLVLVSADFISEGDEIVVMDGGVSIQTYARPARLVGQDDTSGMALLSVEGLSRKPILRSILVSVSDDDLHLAAFPPGEQIASGDAPLWLPVDVVPASGQNQWRVINSKNLPNVSGPILDHCGFLAGMNLAKGAQTMSGGQATAIIGAPVLTALKNLNIQLAPANCDTSAASERGSDESMTAAAVAQAMREPVAINENMPRVIDDNKDKIKPDFIEPKTVLPVGNEKPEREAPLPQAGVSSPAPSVWSLVPWWLWLIIVILLAAIIFKLGTLWRLVNRNAPPAAANMPRHAPVVEPPTIELLRGGSDRSSHGLASHAVAEDTVPDISQLPEGFDAVITVSGQLSDNSKFTRHCIVDKSHIDIIIGRGDADISIEAPTVSRQHARLKGSMNALTFSDLDSNNGTFIGAVPCLPGEIMFVGPNDEITLADVQFRIAVKYKIERLS